MVMNTNVAKVAWTWACSMDTGIQQGHGHSARTRGHGHAAGTWTCSMDKTMNVAKHGHAAWTWTYSMNMDMKHEHGHAP